MTDRVRLLQFEAEDVQRLAREYVSKRYKYKLTRGSVEAEEFVNSIMEICDRARVREIVSSLRRATELRRS